MGPWPLTRLPRTGGQTQAETHSARQLHVPSAALSHRCPKLLAPHTRLGPAAAPENDAPTCCHQFKSPRARQGFPRHTGGRGPTNPCPARGHTTMGAPFAPNLRRALLPKTTPTLPSPSRPPVPPPNRTHPPPKRPKRLLSVTQECVVPLGPPAGPASGLPPHGQE